MSDAQHEIVRRVDALFRLADQVEQRVAAATTRAAQLTQAILAKAFHGELVPTEAELARREGREYEPAAALLERVAKRAESGELSVESQGMEKKSRRRTKHVRFDDLTDPPVPRDTDYASLLVSDVPVVVQHTRLDSRKAEIALMTTVAYGEG